MGRGNWWILASSVQVRRKRKANMEGLSSALQASTGGYRSILEQADQCMYVAIFIFVLDWGPFGPLTTHSTTHKPQISAITDNKTKHFALYILK